MEQNTTNIPNHHLLTSLSASKSSMSNDSSSLGRLDYSVLGFTFRTITQLIIMMSCATALAQTPEQMKANEKQIRDNMVVISRQLGVTCTSCHNTENFKSDKMETFKVAREHMKLTQLLIDAGMNGQKSQKADCYLCHRGKLKPDSVEKVRQH